jgi:hypothetical protein
MWFSRPLLGACGDGGVVERTKSRPECRRKVSSHGRAPLRGGAVDTTAPHDNAVGTCCLWCVKLCHEIGGVGHLVPRTHVDSHYVQVVPRVCHDRQTLETKLFSQSEGLGNLTRNVLGRSKRRILRL